LTARSIAGPDFAVLLKVTPVYINGGLAYDPIRGVIYGGRCCNQTASIDAYDASTLVQLVDRSLQLDNSGSLSVGVDPMRRVAFVYDGSKAYSTRSASRTVATAR